MDNEVIERSAYLLKRTDKPDDGMDTYVGSTSRPLNNRLAEHKYKSKLSTALYANNKLYKRIREVGPENWKMIPLLSKVIKIGTLAQDQIFCEKF